MFGLGRHKSYINKEGYKQKYKPRPVKTVMWLFIVMSQVKKLEDRCVPTK